MPGRVQQRNDGAKDKQQDKKKPRICRGLLYHQPWMIEVGQPKTPEANSPLNKNGYQQEGANQRQKVCLPRKKHQRSGGDTEDLKTDPKRQKSLVGNKLLPFWVCLQVFGVAATALMLFSRQTDFLPLVCTLLLISILIQGAIGFRRLGLPDFDHPWLMVQKPAANARLFFILLFIFGAAISFLDPSWRRLSDQILLDSDLEYKLRHLYSPRFIRGYQCVARNRHAGYATWLLPYPAYH